MDIEQLKAELAGARFAAESHLRTVKSQERIIAGYQAREAAQRAAIQPAGDAVCWACHGSGWVVRDPDIGTDQECPSCGGSGIDEDAAPASPSQPEALGYIDGRPVFVGAELDQRVHDGWVQHNAQESWRGLNINWKDDMRWHVPNEAPAAISEDELCALLPGSHYMDPPDGGSVSVMEQLRRMAEDAAQYRNDLLPAAPLERLNKLVHQLINTCADLHRTSQPVQNIPNGWVALNMIFDEDMNYPEAVAYGPSDMMARLGKKLDKYYASVIATRDATPSPKPVAGEPVPLPDAVWWACDTYEGVQFHPSEEQAKRYSGDGDAVGYCLLEKVEAYGQAREDAALARQSAPVASAQCDALTDSDIRRMATEAYRAGELNWLGFDFDPATDGYGIPSLSLCHYQLVRAVLARLRGQKGGA